MQKKRISAIFGGALMLLSGIERLSGWISGATTGDTAVAFHRIQLWWEDLPILGIPDVQIAFGAVGAIIVVGCILSWLPWKRWFGSGKVAKVRLNQDAVASIPGLTPSAIREAIGREPPLQRDSHCERYLGLSVEWRCSFIKADKKGTDLIRVMVEEPEAGFGAFVVFDVKLSDYPEFRVLEQKAIFIVKGVISSVELGWIELKDAQIAFEVKH
jgi:hypothetical protein